MDFFKSFKKNLFLINPDNFNHHAIDLFKYQAEYNPVYKKYIHYLRIQPSKISRITEIPFLPIEFFKTFQVKTGEWREEKTFRSSGTTGQKVSEHLVEDLQFYLDTSRIVFEEFFGPFSQYVIFGLLPSYLERGDSSLVYMVDHFIKKTGHPSSGFYLYEPEKLIHKMKQINDGRTILLFGVTFALLDLAEQFPLNLPNLMVMDTGGMKGRKKELVREEVHEILKTGLNCEVIHSEYGMTELLSQAYSFGNGKYKTPPWMKVLIRDINDPFHMDPHLKQGGINIIDLANIHSCAFIETKDLGRVNETEGYFEVLGRFDNADTRGCNLMISN